MKCERKPTFVLCRWGFASILISSKRHVCYTAIKLIDTFSTSYFSRSKWIYKLWLNCSSHETTNEFVWFVRIPMMVCGSCESFVLNIRNHLLIDETSENLVWNIPNQLVVCRTQKYFVLDIQNHLIFDETCEEFVSNIRSHLMIFETRECSALNIRICLTIHGTLEDFVHSMQNSLEFCKKYTKLRRI